jgi:hypothetical protein
VKYCAKQHGKAHHQPCLSSHQFRLLTAMVGLSRQEER